MHGPEKHGLSKPKHTLPCALPLYGHQRMYMGDLECSLPDSKAKPVASICHVKVLPTPAYRNNSSSTSRIEVVETRRCFGADRGF